MNSPDEIEGRKNLGASNEMLIPIAAERPYDYRAFDAPWHAQIFALTVHLAESGLFSWAEWTELLGSELRKNDNASTIDSNEFYYDAWLRALEKLMLRLNFSAQDELDLMRIRWEQAYLSTPHGQPVKLDADSD